MTAAREDAAPLALTSALAVSGSALLPGHLDDHLHVGLRTCEPTDQLVLKCVPAAFVFDQPLFFGLLDRVLQSLYCQEVQWHALLDRSLLLAFLLGVAREMKA